MVLVNVATEFLLHTPDGDDRVLEGILPRLQSTWIWYIAGHVDVDGVLCRRDKEPAVSPDRRDTTK